MKKVILFITAFVFSSPLFAQQLEKINRETAIDEMKKTDIEFSDCSQKEGIAKAFIKYAGEDVILMRDKMFPILGIESLTEFYNDHSTENLSLKWEPIKADAAESGEFGFTFGNWELTTKDTVMHGNYVSIWKKNSDGEWKYLLDGGNTTPGVWKPL